MIRTVSVTGSRVEFWQGREQQVEKLVEAVIARIATRWPGATVISGEAPTGVDHWAKLACEHQDVQYQGYPANWRPNGVLNRRAGIERNEQMAEIITDAIIIWDGLSPGTKDMLARCIRHHVHTEIIFPKEIG
jgi:hypothetical protein